MKVTIEDVSTVKKTLHIEVPENDVTGALDSAYQDLKRNAKVKGFRPGKTPRSVLERFYKKDVHADVAARLIQDSFVEAVKENDLKLVGKPEVNPSELEKNSPFTYDATIEVTPELDPIDLKGIPVEKTLYKASDEELDVQLKMLQKNMARHEPLDEDRPAAKDDIVLIDYEGFENVQPMEDTKKTTDFSLKIGEGRIHEDFDAQLIGMNPGDEKNITIQFAEDYFNKKLAGRKVTFKIQLKEIRKEALPDINDSFAKSLGPYKNLDELKEKITENLQEGYDKRAEQEVNEQIFTTLLKKIEFEVPDSLVENELNSIINEAEQSFAARNMNLDDAGLNADQMREKYRDVAVKQVKRQLILSKIIAQEELTLS
ncbi:MAG: trigger factor, partial [Thermodesulfobacteriota bacterium]|nr:trigger factor [Thermodesulfobacteriota bacterium]